MRGKVEIDHTGVTPRAELQDLCRTRVNLDARVDAVCATDVTGERYRDLPRTSAARGRWKQLTRQSGRLWVASLVSSHKGCPSNTSSMG
jgi:hypothetical protein